MQLNAFAGQQQHFYMTLIFWKYQAFSSKKAFSVDSNSFELNNVPKKPLYSVVNCKIQYFVLNFTFLLICKRRDVEKIKQTNKGEFRKDYLC